MENTINNNMQEQGLDEAAAINLLRDYIEKTGKSQSAVAKELGVSDGLISPFLKGKYKATQELIQKIEQLIKISEKRDASPKEPGFKMTSISQKVINTIEYCHLQGKISVAYGDAGIGKTMAALEYCRQNPDAIMITISPCYASITGVNELLADELDVKEKVARHIYKEIVKKIKNTGRVIIIDEAQHLTSRVINHLRSITDASGVGIAFIGNWEIYSKIYGSGQAAYAQLYSRIGKPAKLSINQILLNDIKLLFSEAELEDSAIDVLHKISQTNYGLRGAVNVFVNTIIAYQVSNYSDMNTGRISKIAKEMNIG